MNSKEKVKQAIESLQVSVESIDRLEFDERARLIAHESSVKEHREKVSASKDELRRVLHAVYGGDNTKPVLYRGKDGLYQVALQGGKLLIRIVEGELL